MANDGKQPTHGTADDGWDLSTLEGVRRKARYAALGGAYKLRTEHDRETRLLYAAGVSTMVALGLVTEEESNVLFDYVLGKSDRLPDWGPIGWH